MLEKNEETVAIVFKWKQNNGRRKKFGNLGKTNKHDNRIGLIYYFSNILCYLWKQNLYIALHIFANLGVFFVQQMDSAK